jgi:predicted PurR-regulated permease PerM
MTPSVASRRFFVTLLVASSLLLVVVMRPVVAALFLAVLLSAVLGPFQRRLSTLLRQSPRLSAGIMVLMLVALVAGPVGGFAAYVANESTAGLGFVADTVRSEEVTALVERLPTPARSLVRDGIGRLNAAAGQKASHNARILEKQVLAEVTNARDLLGMVTATGTFLFHAMLMLIALFFLLVEGPSFVRWLDAVSPLREGQTHELLAQLKAVSYALVVSSLITAAIQTAAALIGYALAGVPYPVFFTAATFFVAFIPAIGATAVVQAAAVVLLVNSHPYAALFLSLWGFLVVGLVDNVAKPLLMKRGMHMHPAIVFFALLGGLGAFGMIGLLIGPLTVSLFVTLLAMYKRDFTSPQPVASSLEAE